MADYDLRVGNKAKNLMELEAKGFNIPKTIYLSHEDCEGISNLMLQSENIKCVIETLEANAFFSFEKDLSYPIMVRSSSENEDSKEQSNAGKFLSIYNSHHRMDLIKNIVKVWATKDQAHKMGIVLQQQLSPLYSGVTFVFESEGQVEILIELIIGLGELLVSGHVTPMSINVTGDQTQVLQPLKQFIAMFPNTRDSSLEPTSEFAVKDLAFRVINLNRSLLYVNLYKNVDYLKHIQSTIDAVIKNAKAIYRAFGACDMEWAVTAEDTFYVLQKRPITKQIHGFNRKNMDGEGLTIVPGVRRGVLRSLKNAKKDGEEIIFAPVILPNHLSNIPKALGIISSECALLSHTSILAREIELCYWAGANMHKISVFEDKFVEVDFSSKEIKEIHHASGEMDTTVNEKEMMQVSLPDTIYDPASVSINAHTSNEEVWSENLAEFTETYACNWLVALYNGGFRNGS